MSKDSEKQTLKTVAHLNTMNQKATNSPITQEYNKANRDKLWDSQKRKAEFKDKTFGDKSTYKDPISGEILHKSQNAAQNKYHMKDAEGNNNSKAWSKHSAETDHINALKDVHDIAKHNPFLTDADFKEIMNSDENYRLMSKRDNTSKGSKSDIEIILDKDNGMTTKARVHMTKEKVQADVTIHGKFAVKTVENAGKQFAEGATNALIDSVIPMMALAVNKMCRVASGEESLEDAAKSMGRATVDIAVVGGANQLLVNVVSAQSSNNALIAKLANSNQVGQVVSVAMIVKDAAMKYANGEISEKEFIEEVGVQGTTMVVGMIGGEIGGVIGALIGGAAGSIVLPGGGTVVGADVGYVVGQIIGTIITSVACSAIVSVYQVSKQLDNYKLKENQIRKLETAALHEMENQRSIFKNIVERENLHWDMEVQDGFNMILSSACEETFNLQGATDGLDKILALFGKSVAFHTLDEYEAQLDMPLKLKF